MTPRHVLCGLFEAQEVILDQSSYKTKGSFQCIYDWQQKIYKIGLRTEENIEIKMSYEFKQLTEDLRRRPVDWQTNKNKNDS